MSFRPEQVVKNLARAVEIEQRAVLADPAASALKASLKGGEFVGSTEEGRRYEFGCARWPAEFTGQALLIRRTGSRVPWRPVSVEQLPGNRVRVTSQSDLGSSLQNAQLRIDESTSWAAVRDRLEAAGDQGTGFDRDHAGRIFSSNTTAEQFVDFRRLVPGWLESSPNALQQAAVARSLAAETSFIWGPPGTGKTDLVSRVVEGSYRQGLSILFVAPTRVAVDQATLRICRLLDHEPEFTQGAVQRVGVVDSEDLTSRYGQYIDPKRIVERLQAELLEEIGRLEADLTWCRQVMATYDAEAAAVGELTDLQVQRAELQTAATGGAAQALDSRVAKLQGAAGRQTDDGPSWRARRALEKLDELNKSAEYQSVLHSRRLLAQLEDRLVHVEATVVRIQQEAALLMPREALSRRAQSAQDRLDRLRDDTAGVSVRVAGDRRVLATTVSMAIQSNIWFERFDVVVIDEAGMVDLPHAWLVAGLARQRLVVAGDFRQLPPVTLGSMSRAISSEDRAHAAAWLDQDAFRTAGLVGSDGRVKPDQRLVALDTQYRMRSPICRVVNQVAYPDSPLLTGRAEQSELDTSDLLSRPVTLIDTSRVRISMAPRPNAHLSNAVHVAVIHELVRGLQYGGVLPSRKSVTDLEPSRRLAVITPFNAQKTAMTRSLSYRFGRDASDVVDTIHRFQGSERPLVVFDSVAGAGAKPGFFYEGSGLSSTTCRLLNVALSRAQDHLVVVVDVDYLKSSLPPGSPALHMLAAMEDVAARLPVERLIPTRSGQELDRLSDQELSRPAFFPADEVTRAVTFDLSRASRSIAIYCAFLSPAGLQRWRRALEASIAKGVVVTVYTRAQEQGTPASAVALELVRLGCVLETRERMHEKVVVVDDEILWHGSLNLLATDGPTDLMMRFPDREACAEVQAIVARAQMERPARSFSPEPTPPSGIGTHAPGDVVNGRRYLKVPFEEKDEAKRKFDAQWDKQSKLWHVSVDVPLEEIRHWLPPSALGEER